jgi:pyruvate dehydrogenase E2 component (dihydrolipoamide acetyltransferase)
MPRLSDSMEEGTIISWCKSTGEAVRRGEDLVEIETDKATVTFESEHDGPLQIVAEAGAKVPVGELIAYVGAPSERPAPAASPSVNISPAAPGTPSAPSSPNAPSINISPNARRLADAHGLDIAAISGTGPNGRITRADVTAAVAARDGGDARQPDESPERAVSAAKGDVVVHELTRTQATIARRMAESSATIPDFTLDTDIDMEAAAEALAQLRAGAPADAPPPTVNDLIVKAAALALREFPAVNGAYRDGRFEEYSRVNIGVAVATERALLVPTIFDAADKTIAQIGSESRRLAARVRDETISPAELSGGTFTISNLGMYGVRSFRAIINPPQAAILAVGAVRPVPTVRDGQLASQQLMSVTLSCDHRILYGAEAAQFLSRLGTLLGNPSEWCFSEP